MKSLTTSINQFFQSETISEISYTLFRLYCGISIGIGAGYAKFPSSDWFTEQVADIGFTFPSPEFWSIIAIWGEFVGGLLIAVGLITRFAAFQLAFQFFVVSFIWYKEPEFFGMYYQQLIFWSFVFIAFKGNGKYSLSNLFKRIKMPRKALVMGLLFIGISSSSFAGERIEGNGKIVTKQKTVEQFFSIELETFCNVVVNNGSMPMVKLEVDENLQDVYEIIVEDGVLKVNTDKWPEPTKILLTVQAPFITSFTNAGWGKIQINELNTQVFKLNSETGSVSINGSVDELSVQAATGAINAKMLSAKRISIEQGGHGTTLLGTSDELTVRGRLGRVLYKGNPSLNNMAEESLLVKSLDVKTADKLTTSKKKKVTYVKLRIRNNSMRWGGFVIRGPRNSPFSYGFSIFPYRSKSEKVPVGTKFFTENITGGEKFLYEVKLEDEGKTVNLFE